MARARTLVPAFFTDERIVSVSAFARLLFQGLWTEADREGRLEDKPLVLKMRLFPADAVDVKALLEELVNAGLVCRYAVQGRALLLIPKFKDHQHVHPKEAPSKLPAPPALEISAEKVGEREASTGTRENEPCMTVEPGNDLHGEGVSTSDVQAFRPSGLQAFRPSAGRTQPAKPAAPAVPPEDQNTRWLLEAQRFVSWAKAQAPTLSDPGPPVYAWAQRFFLKHQPADPELVRVAFARFLLWCHQAGKTVGWGLWLSDAVWEPRWAEVRADAQAKRGAA